MKRQHDTRQLLRWYPTSWQARYGEEFLALVEDRLDGAPLTLGFRLSVALAGLRERSYVSGVLGSRSSYVVQRRTGSLMVLVAWSIMAVGGAGFAKSAEHFAASLPIGSRVVADSAYNATVAAGIAGTLLVLAGAFVAVPGFVRSLCATRRAEMRKILAKPLVAAVVVLLATLGLSSWAHHLNPSQRNGGDLVYSVPFLAYALLVVLTIALWTRVSIAAASGIDFTPRALRWESSFALGVSLSSIVVIGSTALWWVQMGLHAPWFLQGTATGVAASPWSAQLVATVIVMTLATVTALWGASRVALTYQPTRRIAG